MERIDVYMKSKLNAVMMMMTMTLGVKNVCENAHRMETYSLHSFT